MTVWVSKFLQLMPNHGPPQNQSFVVMARSMMSTERTQRHSWNTAYHQKPSSYTSYHPNALPSRTSIWALRHLYRRRKHKTQQQNSTIKWSSKSEGLNIVRYNLIYSNPHVKLCPPRPPEQYSLDLRRTWGAVRLRGVGLQRPANYNAGLVGGMNSSVSTLLNSIIP